METPQNTTAQPVGCDALFAPFAPFVAWLGANDKPKTAKKLISEFIGEIGALDDSRNYLTWLANLAIVELESQDADNRLREIADNARESHIATIRRGA